METSYQINAAIQLLPIGVTESKIATIDKAIQLIQNSGLNYKVCPFETVVEGSPEKVYGLIRQIQDSTLAGGCPELLINIQDPRRNPRFDFSRKVGEVLGVEGVFASLRMKIGMGSVDDRNTD